MKADRSARTALARERERREWAILAARSYREWPGGAEGSVCVRAGNGRIVVITREEWEAARAMLMLARAKLATPAQG